jgi:hypothetical protein
MSVSTGELANRSTSTERAAQLEVHAAEFPEQRGMLLLEAALAWRRAGQSQRATQLIDGLIATGGEDGCYARVQRVEFCLADDAWPQAEAQLAILAHEPSLYEGHCTLIAELLIEHHRLQAAARWYDRGLARLTPQTLRALAGPRGWTQLGALTMLRGRRDLRSRLGQAPDATDELVTDPSHRLPDRHRHTRTSQTTSLISLQIGRPTRLYSSYIQYGLGDRYHYSLNEFLSAPYKPTAPSVGPRPGSTSAVDWQDEKTVVESVSATVFVRLHRR